MSAPKPSDPAHIAESVRTVSRFQAVCPDCKWVSEELYDNWEEARWRSEKHQVHVCDGWLHNDGRDDAAE